jgi:hypothetical protein
MWVGVGGWSSRFVVHGLQAPDSAIDPIGIDLDL